VQEIYYADEVYRADGIRDPFRWARFSNPRFFGVGALVVVMLILASGRDPNAAVAGEALAVGSHVAAEAVRTARASR
jgi:hypothetical protein